MTRFDPSHTPISRGSDAPQENGAAGWQRGRPFAGIVPPLVTPLAGRDALDLAGLERLVEHVLGGGVHGLFLLGTTGELASLSPRIRRELIDRVVEIVGGRVPVLVGVTDNSIVETIALACYAADAGARAVVVTSPFYIPLESHELESYVQMIAAETPLPIVLYNMPRLTKTWFEAELVRELIQIEQIIGLKDSSGDLNYFEQVCLLARARPDWSVLVGPEQLLVDALERGGHGCVGGGGNVWPQLLVELYQAAREQHADRIAACQQRLGQLVPIMGYGHFAVSAIRGLKSALNVLGICSDRMAEPFSPCDEQQRHEIQRLLEAAEITVEDRSVSASRRPRVGPPGTPATAD